MWPCTTTIIRCSRHTTVMKTLMTFPLSDRQEALGQYRPSQPRPGGRTMQGRRPKFMRRPTCEPFAAVPTQTWCSFCASPKRFGSAIPESFWLFQHIQANSKLAPAEKLGVPKSTNIKDTLPFLNPDIPASPSAIPKVNNTALDLPDCFPFRPTLHHQDTPALKLLGLVAQATHIEIRLRGSPNGRVSTPKW